MPDNEEYKKNKEFISYCGTLMDHIESWKENGISVGGKSEEELIIHEDSLEFVKMLSKVFFEGDYDFKGFD